MNRQERENLVKQITAQGNRAVLEEEWTPQLALDVIRENRRRHAGEARTRVLSHFGGHLAEDLAAKTGVAPADIVTVLLLVSSTLAGPALHHQLPGVLVTDLLGYAADDLDRQANGGDAW
ncbi:hypothetical protein [Streptomyces sp. T028]|uniref:hypothetical protein n=1 Tax=Streptomyces sp. T028 TaxID=3394379 RepID=UPI003A86A234